MVKRKRKGAVMTKYEIKKNIDIPKVGGLAHELPFGDMDIGDCFDVEFEKINSARMAAFRYAAQHRKKFMTRTIVVDGNSILRIWRIE